jgi:glycyl-tRNA synthetase beta chain
MDTEVKMSTLLIEIGCEEIPASYIAPALEAFSSMLLKKLDDARIEHGRSNSYATPRRLAVMVSEVAAKQNSVSFDVVGPPEKVAFDAQGKPTVAAEKFAEKAGVSVKSLKLTETEKGRYLSVRKTERGLASPAVLKNILPDVIKEIPFPKSMRWADFSTTFARPIHWFLALFDGRVISFSIENMKSGRITYGHRFLSPGKIALAHPDHYVSRLKDAHVWVDIQERKHEVQRSASTVAASKGGDILEDPELLDTVTNLVELAAPVAGTFETKFLRLPAEILITAMREHQKYFAVVDKTGHLMPCFIAVNNTAATDMNLVATGHERVIRARLADAEFFYQSDLKTPSETRFKKLSGVLFQARLGSMLEKVKRVESLAGYLADILGMSDEARKKSVRAAHLSKSDLVSQVVGEFPKLQGVMGKIYATVEGEHDEVASAIEEHYRPVYSGGQLPQTKIGALVAIADKIDSICGCFSVGLFPTGGTDPYALRRQGIGVVQILLDKGYGISIKELIEKAAAAFGDKATENLLDTVERVYTFLKNRMSHLLAEEGFSKDVIAAVLSISADHIPSTWNRVRALEALKSAPDFDPLVVAFKRVVNIIRKAETVDISRLEESLFEHESESALLASLQKVETEVPRELQGGKYDLAFKHVASLRGPIDNFFDNVLVMAEKDSVRINRLAMLQRIANLFDNFADFSKLSA